MKLKDMLTIENIDLKVKTEDWEDAIRQAGKSLIENNMIEPEYIDNMIQSVHELGPYIVIVPGIAFAHARPDKTVNETCISMITLEKPINFGHEENDPVSIVFAFGAKDGEHHLTILQELAVFLSEEENINFLNNAKDKTSVINKFNKY